MAVYVARIGDECNECHKDKLIFEKAGPGMFSNAHLICPSCGRSHVLFYLTEEDKKNLGDIVRPNDSVRYVDF